jgi:hypothetical protein
MRRLSPTRRLNGVVREGTHAEARYAPVRLRLTVPLHPLSKIDTQAAERLEGVAAAGIHYGRIFATEDLRFSQLLSNAKRPLSYRTAA